MKPEKLFITKKEIKNNIDTLYKKILSSGKKYDYVVGIARGGIHISKPLARKLKAKHTDIRVSFYNYHQTYYPQIIDLQNLQKLPIRKNILIVDDLIDGGNSINWLNTNIKDYYDYDTAVAYYNAYNGYQVVPTFFADYKPQAWIVFPWEVK